MQQERRIGQNKITGARTTMRVIVIGAGIGGLCCGAKLAKDGNHVLILEENAHIGGTSYIFSRGEYSFPMALWPSVIQGASKPFLLRLELIAR